jgi:hypothetical protein
MRNDVIKQRPWWTATVAVIAGLSVLATATGALAHDDDEREWKHHGHHFIPPGHVYYYGPPAYYAPRPVVVYPAPVYYEPAPVYYPPPGLNLNFNVPLR